MQRVMICLPLLAALILFWALAAGAAQEHTFQSLDRDQDGVISAEEYYAAWPKAKHTEKNFKALDHDNDGKLTSKDGQHLFYKMDKNKDGKISQDEYLEHFTDKDAAREDFRRLDRDHDGYISQGEFWGYWPTIRVFSW